MSLNPFLLHPSENRRVVDFHSSLTHHFCYLAVWERIIQVPTHAEQDELRLVMTPLEQVWFRHKNKSRRMQSLTLPCVAPVFATQPPRVPPRSRRCIRGLRVGGSLDEVEAVFPRVCFHDWTIIGCEHYQDRYGRVVFCPAMISTVAASDASLISKAGSWSLCGRRMSWLIFIMISSSDFLNAGSINLDT